MRTTHSVTNVKLQEQLQKVCDDWIATLDDPMLRALAMSWLLDSIQSELVPNVSAVRVAAVRQLRMQGFTLAELGAELGLSRARIDKIAKS
jgi:DNA-directed RNA polymerase sigma subunit (sigma70/sigma32)